MRDKMATSAYIFEKGKKDPFLRLQIRAIRILSVDGVSRFYLKYTWTKI